MVHNYGSDSYYIRCLRMTPSRKNVGWVGGGHRCDLGSIILLKAGGRSSFFSWNRSSPWVGGFGLTIFWLHGNLSPDARILLASVILFILGHLGVLIIFLVIHGQDIRWGGTGSFSSVFGGLLDKSHLRVCRIDSFRDLFGYLFARDFFLAVDFDFLKITFLSGEGSTDPSSTSSSSTSKSSSSKNEQIIFASYFL